MVFRKNRDLYSVIRLCNRGYPNIGIWLSRFLPALLHRKRFYSSVLRFPIPFNTNPLFLTGLLYASTANLTHQVFRILFLLKGGFWAINLSQAVKEYAKKWINAGIGPVFGCVDLPKSSIAYCLFFFP